MRVLKYVSTLAIATAILAGCSNAEPSSKLSNFPQSVAQMTQSQKNHILEFKYLDLSEADQQLWIDVYASEYKVGFDKAQTKTTIMDMTQSEGIAKTDTHQTLIIVYTSLTDMDFESLQQSQCQKPPLIWAMNNGLTLQTTFRSEDGEISTTMTVNRETCNL